jgi:hypothetical protein
MSNDPRGWLNWATQMLYHSPLYTYLFSQMKTDAEILNLLTLIDADQPNLVLFFSAINFLLLSNPQDPFAAFFPYLSAHPRPVTEAYSYFRTFCFAHEQELQNLLPTARLQTNEVTRCANLVPAFALVYQYGGYKPLAGIELGASGGLNLNWDRYQYIYNNNTYALGENPDAYTLGEDPSVQIHCTLRGNFPPLFPRTMPRMASRVGIELLPINLNNERDVNWIRGCIWPEEIWRYQLLDAALAFAQQYPPHVLAGDACELLPDVLVTIPSEQTICIWHSFALAQGPAHVRERIEQFLADFSRERTIYRVSLELDPADPTHPDPRLEVFTYQRGERQSEWLASCALHGEHMQWRVKP